MAVGWVGNLTSPHGCYSLFTHKPAAIFVQNVIFREICTGAVTLLYIAFHVILQYEGGGAIALYIRLWSSEPKVNSSRLCLACD